MNAEAGKGSTARPGGGGQILGVNLAPSWRGDGPHADRWRRDPRDRMRRRVWQQRLVVQEGIDFILRPEAAAYEEPAARW